VNWATKRLSEVTRRLGGGTPSREKKSFWNGDIPWFTVADLSDVDDIQLLTSSREAITEAGLECSAAKLIPAGSVVFSSRVVVGKVGIARNQLATNQDFSSFIPSSELDQNFLAYFLIKTKGDLRRHQRGATIKGVTTQVLDSLEVPLPPVPEQRRIVVRIKECLQRVEEIECLRTQAIQEAEAVLPSVLNEVFTSQASSARAQTIGDIALETRYGTSQKCHAEPVGMPILRIPNVAQGSVNFDGLKYSELGKSDTERVRLEDGDLLFVRTNGSRDLVGRCAVFQGDSQSQAFGFASYLIRVRVDQAKVLPRYLAYFLNSTNGRAEIDSRRRTSAGQFNINSENLRSIEFPVPSVPEQALLLEQLELRESLARQLVAEIREVTSEGETMRESILRKAFAGEL
jgi:type I restriction enzyme S subunit